MRMVLGLDSLSLHETYLVQLTASAIITYCHYYFHSKNDLLRRNVAILPIQCPVQNTRRGKVKTSYVHAMTVSKSINPSHGCWSTPILIFLSMSYYSIIHTGFVAYYISTTASYNLLLL